MLLSDADASIGELSGLGRYLPNPQLLITPYSRREAVLSSRIEGTQASLSDLLFDELKLDVEPERRDDVREVRNYVRALRLGIQRLSQLPFSTRLVREVHQNLMRSVRGQEKTPGEFRTSQNWIGPSGRTPETAPFVPPPPGSEMLDALADWERFGNQRGRMPDLVQCAILHERFEAIHPFLDGNGRVGRLLITLFLIARERLSQPLLYLSAFIEAHRQEYYDLLQQARTRYDRHAWVRFFLTGVLETSRQAIAQAHQLLDLRDKWRRAVKSEPRARSLIDLLFLNPYVTIAGAAKALEVSQPTAAKSIARLVNLELLREATGRSWGRIYVSDDILRAIEHPTPPQPPHAGAGPDNRPRSAP